KFHKIKNILDSGEDIIYEVIFESIDESLVLEHEKHVIDAIGIDNLTNLVEGGVGGYNQVAAKINKQRAGKRWEDIYSDEGLRVMRDRVIPRLIEVGEKN